MFVAGFIGSPQMNFIQAKVEKDGDVCVLVFNESRIPVKDEAILPYVGKEVIMGIRPEDIHLEGFETSCEKASITARLNIREVLGSEMNLYVTCEGQKLTAKVLYDGNVKEDEDVKLVFDVNKIHVFDKDTEAAICH